MVLKKLMEQESIALFGFQRCNLQNQAIQTLQKGDTLTFITPTMEGTIMLDDSGDWKKEQTFSTEAEAIVYLQDKSGVKAQSVLPVSSLESGTLHSSSSKCSNIDRCRC